MKINWSQHIHSGWRRILGLSLIIFGLLSSVYYYMDMHFIAQSNNQSLVMADRPSPSPSVFATVLSMRSSASPNTTPMASAEPNATSKIKLTTATQTELESLPLIGPAKAKAILAYRELHGFKTVSDLQKVKGIGAKTMEKLKPLIEL